ncbi:hypothetical protein CLOM_g5764, partial [Closterium sp. NIES-68]
LPPLPNGRRRIAHSPNSPMVESHSFAALPIGMTPRPHMFRPLPSSPNYIRPRLPSSHPLSLATPLRYPHLLPSPLLSLLPSPR